MALPGIAIGGGIDIGTGIAIVGGSGGSGIVVLKYSI
jgi:hypothetical protein